MLDYDDNNRAQVDLTVTATGRKLKPVRCENCGHQYVYMLKRQASGGASALEGRELGAEDKARTMAQSILDRKMKGAVDLVPCPKCGWVQERMIPVARRQHLAWMLWLGAALGALFFPIGGIGLAVGVASQFAPNFADRAPTWQLILFAGLLCLGLVGLGLVFAKWIFAAGFDPNQGDAEYWKDLGRRRAIKPKKLARLMEIFEDPDREVDMG